MRKFITTNQSFTLMEIITVVVIIGVMAAFAIPNYTASIERAHQRDATNNLIAVHAVNSIFRTENGDTWPAGGVWEDLAAINSNLRLSIIANGMEYRCRKPGLLIGQYTCEACRPNCTTSTFKLTLNETPIVDKINPACSGACP